MKTRVRLAAALAAAVFIAGLSGCTSGNSGNSASKGPIKIGLAAPLTGASAQDGISIKNGAQIAIDRINADGGIDGRLVELEVMDDKTDPKEAAIVANKLAEDKEIVAVVGHFNSSATLAGAPIYNKAGVVEISPGSSSSAVTDAGDYTFRVITTDAFQGQYLAEWAIVESGFEKIAILYENSDYGKGLSDVVVEKAVELGGTIVVNESYLPGETTDFNAILTNVKTAEPDVIFIGGLYNEAALIAKQAKQQGLDVPFMGVDAIYSDALIELGGEAAEGILLMGFFHESTSNAVAQEFMAAYQEAHGAFPGTYAAYAYDATLVVLEAIKNVGTDRQAICDYIAAMKDFQGATGINTFDENGDVLKDPIKLVIRDGKFEIYG